MIHRGTGSSVELFTQPVGSAPRLSWSLQRRTSAAMEGGVVAGARIQAAAYAAHHGMVSIALISAEANHLAAATPGLDPADKARTAERLNSIADTYAQIVTAEIAGLGW